jgi:prepilin-type N-terminal cleavage/methylation domain-containing protein
MKRSYSSGFTLIEILLVVAAIAILAGIVILAINPSKQLAEMRNTQRRADVNTILNAVYQYAIDSNGLLPTGITSSTCATVAANEICKTEGTCTGLVNLSVLTANEKYLISMPIDPNTTSTNGTGYRIARSGNGRITVCAPNTEQGAMVSLKR